MTFSLRSLSATSDALSFPLAKRSKLNYSPSASRKKPVDGDEVMSMDMDEEKIGVIASENHDATATFDPDLYHQNEWHQTQIDQEIIERQPLVGEKIPIDVLKGEYAPDDHIYQRKVDELIKTYRFIRRTRGDGNCFYRAFAFAYLEHNRTNVEELNRFEKLAAELKDQLVKLSYAEYAVEGIEDTVLEVIRAVRDGVSEEKLMEIFTNSFSYDYMVVYLRLFVSAHLQLNQEFFENFIEGHATVRDFCMTEVEPMRREADNIHIIALTNATNVPLRVIYMDRSEKSLLTTHDFPETSNGFHPMITLLYRPGHYDLLYE